MKQYRLMAWPELGAPFDRTPHRRMLSDMSQRHVSLSHLVGTSGLRRREVRKFVTMLCHRGIIGECVAERPQRRFRPLHPLGGWLRRRRSGVGFQG